MHFRKRNFSLAIIFGFGNLVALAQPVSISDFSLFRNGKSVVLHWTIDSGATCNGTTILRGTDTVNYVQAGFIPGICGSSTSPTSYTFTDDSPALNQVNYYKLQLGLSQYSEVRSIFVEYLDAGAVLIKADREEGLLTFKFNNDAKEIFSLSLYDSSGRAAFRKDNITESEIPVQNKDFKAGTYFYLLTNHSRNYTGRLLLER